jgi:RNA polymerase sigma factor (sigma-70 family)
MNAFFRSSLATDAGAETDGELLDRVRDGEQEAYGLLYERHCAVARRFARSIVWNDADVDDVVGEAFAAVLLALDRGKGPIGSFLPYLMNTVRHECYRVNRRSKRQPVDRYGTVEKAAEEGDARHDPFVGVDEAEVVRVALESLPANVRDVLWRTAVDDSSPDEIAEGRGGTANAAAVTAFRARRAFGSAYLQQHLAERDAGNVDEACRRVRPHLARFVRGTVGTGHRRRLEEHLETCESCEDDSRSLGRLNRHLRSIPFLPFEFGDGLVSLGGIKAQVLGWLSTSVAPLATSGAFVVGTLAPPVTSVPSQPPIVEVNSVGSSESAGGDLSSDASIDVAHDVFPHSIRPSEVDVLPVLDPESQASLRHGGVGPGNAGGALSDTDVDAGPDNRDSDNSAGPNQDAETDDPRPALPYGPHDSDGSNQVQSEDGGNGYGNDSAGTGTGDSGHRSANGGNHAGNVNPTSAHPGNGKAGNAGNAGNGNPGNSGNAGSGHGNAVNANETRAMPATATRATAETATRRAAEAEAVTATRATPMPETANAPMVIGQAATAAATPTTATRPPLAPGPTKPADDNALTAMPSAATTAAPLSTGSNAEADAVVATSGTTDG